ncbi:DNA polymerase I [Natronospirillum operosum]|uniref:DNA polymerase I n=1 Tax=Natronospirillum operosum TaxID=2759953 RepID=A0A4Z0WCV8_9GAMM|nr:DNA polymerase I [Natronospirillum operosum]TGG91545.1 DNA polymerase I [Natronospirillum operosum]
MSDSQSAPAPVVLIDGSSYLFRAFHAMPPLTNQSGHPTGAIKGVINMVRAMLDQYPDSPVAVVFDAKGPTFRNELYAEYKANRPPMPDELRPQIEPIHEIIIAMGLPLLCIEGVEADDVIGTLAREATESGRGCVISTGDKDMAQLVTPHVSLINTMSNEALDVDGVTEKYGFGPELMIDYLALMGDKSDNIPGVPGVGEKTAKALLSGIGGIDELYRNLDRIPELDFRGAKTMPKKLQEHEELARLSYELATIKCDVELDVRLADLRRDEPDEPRLAGLYRKFEFSGWLKALTEKGVEVPEEAAADADRSASSAPQEDAVPDQLDYQTLSTPAAWYDWLQAQSAAPHLALWPVLEKSHYRSFKWLGLAVSTGSGQAVYVDFRAEDWPQDALQPLLPLFNQHSYHKVTHDLKRLLHALYPVCPEPSHLQDDVMIMGFVRDATVHRDPELDRHFDTLSLDNLVRVWLHEQPRTIVDIAGKFGTRQTALPDLDPATLATFACERADYVGRLYRRLASDLQQQYPDQWRVYEHIETPLVPVLQQVEWTGTRVDADFLAELSAGFRSQLETLEQQAHAAADKAFNLDSPKQLGEVLFTDLGLPVVAKTPSGQPSTNEEVLTELSHQYELPALVLRYRHLRKLLNTYTEPLPDLINPDTGRVHTSYHQTGAQTGRLSSSEPNLQNIPIRSEEGRAIRKAFVAAPGYRILAADYSQIELRIMTHLSEDANLIRAFRDGKDIHRATAAEIMGLPEDQVTGEQRRAAKAVNFGLIYGMSAFGLARNLGIPRGEAQTYVDTYFQRYPGVRAYMDRTRAQAAEDGYVETVFGRRLYLPDIRSSRQQQRRAAERTAINAPMQGTAADIIKQAMVDVQVWLTRSQLDARMVMQVHDELVFEVAEQDLEAVRTGVVFRMQHAASLSVPLVVDVGVGKDWGEAH